MVVLGVFSTHVVVLGAVVEDESDVSQELLHDVVMVEVLSRQLLSDLHKIHGVRDHVVVVGHQLQCDISHVKFTVRNPVKSPTIC